MRIAIIGPAPPSKGGIAQHTGNVVDAFRAIGHEVLVVSWRIQYPSALYKGSEEDEGAALSGQHRILSWWNPIGWLRARRLIRRFDPDVVWSPWVTPFHAVPLRVAVGSARSFRVIHVHNARPHEPMPFSDRLTRLGLKPADALAVHSSTISREIRELGLTQPTIEVPHPPNIQLVASAPPESPPFRLLFLGFVRPYKGLDLALEALDQLPEEVRLTVAGEFWEPVDVWEERIETMGLSARVVLSPRYQSDEEMAELLGSHHVLVCPYRSATQSGLVPLAHAAGRPVVATNVGGLSEAVDSGTDGVLCEVDGASLAAGIEAARIDYVALVEGALASRLTWNDYARSVESLLERGTSQR